MSLKICKKCNLELPQTEYHNSIKFGLYPICKSCVSKRRKELKLETLLRLKTELHKIVLVENKMLRMEGLSQCHTCRVQIPLHKTNHYCSDCQKEQRERNREKVLASKKAYRDRNKAKQKAYNESIKEARREYDARRYQLRKEK